MFAYAVLKLVAQGKLDLDTPVMAYLPQGYRHQRNLLAPEPSDLVTDPQLAAITVRMVLNHTSGLPNWTSGVLRAGAAPGTKWDYSGDGFVMLTNSENGMELAPPLARKILPGQHTVFQSAILGTDLLNVLCNTLRICL
ncbi:serine hydrolase [Massilia violaceinigra]|uniref:serine hydrolase n=1 Tax=Massilia violaceinigra TaxID=2045208 RepID=UPI001FB26DCD|nr:serine hydrolase domain-containing protein [Massilia violaceinigra]